MSIYSASKGIMSFEKFYDAGAGAYDRVFGRMSRDFASAFAARQPCTRL
jgi:hypothetical protein